jgi:argininosuccinate lyase
MAGLSIVSGSAKSHKLWGGRFSVPTAASLEALNRSITTDFRLWSHDVRLSIAWASALQGAGVLTRDESRAIENGLTKVGEKFAEGALPQPSD